MKKINTFLRNNVLTFVIGLIVCSTVVVLAVDTIASNSVTYDNSQSNSSETTVQGAINDLYTQLVYKGASITFTTSLPGGISTNLQGYLYRYQGTTADNYICFGTTTKSICTENPNTYMYRIIGIDASGKMKLIKSTPLSTTYAWHSNDTEDINWPVSDLYNGLNGSYFLTNTTYVPSGWEDRIARTDWHYWKGNKNTATNYSAEDFATYELGAATTKAKIGLMYLHDYAYGIKDGNVCSSAGNYTTCMTSWIFLGSTEYLIASDTNTVNAWNVYATGYTTTASRTTKRSIRPVFYLRAIQRIASGSGTLSDPYILT